jgi:hypothetical protein
MNDQRLQKAQQQLYLNNLAAGLRLVSTEDFKPAHGIADRDITYQVKHLDGSAYSGTEPGTSPLYVNEHLDQWVEGTKKIGEGDYSSASPDKNQWGDFLGIGLGTSSIDRKQTFTVSGAPGLYPSLSARILVRYGGKDYGALALHMGSDHVVTVNGLTKFPNTKP